MATPQRKPILTKQTGKGLDQYISQLESLLKKNTGTGLFVGEDTSSNIPMYIPGRVANPTGLGDSASMIKNYQAPAPAPVQRTAQPMQYQDTQQDYSQDYQQPSDGWRRQEVSPTDPGYQYAVTQPYTGGGQQVPQIRGIASMPDGGVLFEDGLIRYDDGTARQYSRGGENAIGIQSMQDGSVLYSDGSIRRQQTTQEQSAANPSQQPIGIQTLPDGRVLYSDGVVREYVPTAPETSGVGQVVPSQPGVVNFYEKFPQNGNNWAAYGYDPNSAYTGQCAWFSQQITSLPDGSSWRVGNSLQEKRAALQRYESQGFAFKPGQEEPQVGNSIISNEGYVDRRTGINYGHVSTISEIFKGQDGKTYYRLTESNFDGTETVTHDRVIPADDRRIQGIIKTVPKNGYELRDYSEAPEITGERSQDPINGTVSNSSGEQERSGDDTQDEKFVQSLPPVSSNQQGGRFENSASFAPQVTDNARQNFGSQQVGQYPAYPGEQTIKNVTQSIAKAAEPMSPQREQIGEGINTVGNIFAQQGIGEKIGNSPEGFVGAGELAKGDVLGARTELADTIDRMNPTKDLDFGGSELLRGDVLGAAQNFGNAAQRIGNRLSRVPEQIKDIIVPEVQADDGTPQPKEESLTDNIKYVANSVGKKVGQELSAAGQGISSLAGAGVAALQNVFKPTVEKPTRAVGDVTGTAKLDESGIPQFSSLMDTAGTVAGQLKNDIRDQFFKMGGQKMYSDYLKPNAEQLKGGALTLDLFNDNFFSDLGNIVSVFGGSKDYKAAGDKYLAKERAANPLLQKQAYKNRSDSDYFDGYDDYTDDYNRYVESYNKSINDYLNSISSSINSNAKTPSIFTPGAAPSVQNIFPGNTSYQPASIAQSAPVQYTKSSPVMSYVDRYSAPSLNATPYNANYSSQNGPAYAPAPQQANYSSQSGPKYVAAPTLSKPSPQAARPSGPSQNYTPSNANYSSQSGAASYKAPPQQSQSRPAPQQSKPAPQPSKPAPVSKPAQQSKPAPKPVQKPNQYSGSNNQSKAPAPQSQPKQNVFSKAASTVSSWLKNIFR